MTWVAERGRSVRAGGGNIDVAKTETGPGPPVELRANSPLNDNSGRRRKRFR